MNKNIKNRLLKVATMLSTGAFMQPEYWFGVMYVVESKYGDTEYYDEKRDVIDAWVEAGSDQDRKPHVVKGWWCRLSAPGYLDATDISGPFKSEKEARAFIEEHYEVDPDTGQ